MTEGRTRPRGRRSTETSRRLERVRERNARQLAEQRDREKRVNEALRAYVVAGERITTAEEECAAKVAEYERRIDGVRSRTRERVTGHRAEQARAALTIHEGGRTVEQVAELLEMSRKDARRLIAEGREVGTTDGPSEKAQVAPPEPQPGTEPVPVGDGSGSGAAAAASAAPGRESLSTGDGDVPDSGDGDPGSEPGWPTAPPG